MRRAGGTEKAPVLGGVVRCKVGKVAWNVVVFGGVDGERFTVEWTIVEAHCAGGVSANVAMA